MADILVVGIAVVDAIARPVNALPAPGGLRFFNDLAITTGGCAINCAIALKRLGVECTVVARVGADALGDIVASELGRAGVSASGLVRDPERPTSFSFVAVPEDGERAFLHTCGANARLVPADIPDSALHAAAYVFVAGAMLMDGFDGLPAATFLERARSRGAVTLLDTVFVEGASAAEWSRRVLPSLPHLDYFMPSESEALALTGAQDAHAALDRLRSAGARRVVIKLGARGVLCADENDRRTTVPAFSVLHIVDATGAGDCWAAGFIAGLREGMSMPDAARLGNAVASISVQAAGATTALTDRTPVDALLRRQ